MLQIHEKIKQARLSAGLTEGELAEKIGIKRSTYQYWETSTPGVDNIKRVAKALGKNQDYFFVNDEDFVSKDEPDKDKTIYNLSEAQIMQARVILILAEKINLGSGAGASLDDEEEQKGNVQADFPFSGNTKRKRKRRGT